jgi:glycosyltransferase involved in cell wall biosynthesis
MIIAVNTGLTANGFLNSTADFIFNCFSLLASQYPQHQFIYFTDKELDKTNTAAKNSTVIVTGMPTKNPLLLQYWLNYKLPALLRRHKVDVFVSTGCCSLRTKVPQCIIINDLSFLQHPQFFTKSWLRFYKKNTIKFLDKAAAVISTSQFVKKQIADEYKIQNDKIEVVYPGINQIFKPANWQVKDAVKEKYTEGLEYFLYSGSIKSLVILLSLLKAFSLFKKRQKSNMQLVIASSFSFENKDFVKSLSTYKFRQDVKIVDNLSEEKIAEIIASAYVAISISILEIYNTRLLQALQCDTPLITNNSLLNKETCGDAALYINPDDFNDIADKMMLLFKDEDLRNRCIIKGRQQAALYHWDKTAALVWEAINKCAN